MVEELDSGELGGCELGNGEFDGDGEFGGEGNAGDGFVGSGEEVTAGAGGTCSGVAGTGDGASVGLSRMLESPGELVSGG